MYVDNGRKLLNKKHQLDKEGHQMKIFDTLQTLPK